jgi:RNA polymerase sigma-70 factor (ECF subfamily)
MLRELILKSAHQGLGRMGTMLCSQREPTHMTAQCKQQASLVVLETRDDKSGQAQTTHRGETERARMSEAQVDQLLVERVQKGDKHAFDLLINKYQHRIVSLVSRYVSDHAEAMDVAQESFIKAYRAMGKFRGDSAFYTWLYRIAINTAKNYLVAQKRRPPASDIDAVDAEQYDMDSRLKDKGTPENEMMRDEIKRMVYKTIAELPEDLRTAIMLREMEGMSYEDIALTMDCPIGTVRSRIFRAREAIDEKLKPLV